MLRNEQVEIQSKRANEMDFATIAFDAKPPFIDKRPPLVPGQPEKRQFRLRFINDDVASGDWSLIVEVTARE